MSKISHKKEYGLSAVKAEAYARMVQRILDSAVNQMADAVIEEGYSGQEWFSFDDYPDAKRAYEKLQNRMVRDIRAVVVNGVTAVWEDSNFKNDALANQILGNRAKLAAYKGYFDNNEAALTSFIRRQRNGLNLSGRIWKLEREFKTNLEATLSVGMSEGMSADKLSREIREYLHEPKKMFRRIKEFDTDDKFRKWKLSIPAGEYNPGKGQYRSSYKNAMRLTRTEINMAYRTADQKRWNQLDFVVGFEVKRSMSSHFYCPQCDALADKYPKNFLFTGWHPQCLCYAIPILKTASEIDRDEDLILRGEEPSEESVNRVATVPDSFLRYVKQEAPRIDRMKTKPYFIRDNRSFIPAAK